jgi:hypothetical protein
MVHEPLHDLSERHCGILQQYRCSQLYVFFLAHSSVETLFHLTLGLLCFFVKERRRKGRLFLISE